RNRGRPRLPPDLVGFGAVPFETEPHRVTEYAKTARPYSISCRADLLVRLPKIPVPSPGQPPIRHKMQLANLWQGSCFIPFHTIFILHLDRSSEEYASR